HVALAVRRSTSEQGHLARGLDANRRALPWPKGADLEIAGQADAKQRLARIITPGRLFSPELGVIAHPQQALERGIVVARVVRGAHWRRVRELLGMQEILAAHLSWI